MLMLMVCACTPAEGDQAPAADDTSTDTGDPGAEDTDGDTGTATTDVDYRGQGSVDVQADTVDVVVDSDCTMEVTLYGSDPSSLVVLSHGFAREPSHVAGWGLHLASWGLTVAVPGLCHASMFDSDHDANGDELVALAEQLGASEVIWVGHSAGGLASLLAGAREPDTVAVVALDLTDADGLGASEASGVSAPVFALVGEPSSCNSDNNGVDALRQVDQLHGLRITEADHCDFESDTDAICTAFCAGTNDQFSDAQLARDHPRAADGCRRRGRRRWRELVDRRGRVLRRAGRRRRCLAAVEDGPQPAGAGRARHAGCAPPNPRPAGRPHTPPSSTTWPSPAGHGPGHRRRRQEAAGRRALSHHRWSVATERVDGPGRCPPTASAPQLRRPGSLICTSPEEQRHVYLDS